jgi:hypothetical protein
MAADTRRQMPMLVGLLVVLAAVTYWQFGGASPAPVRPGGRPPPAAVKPPSGGAPESPESVLARGVGLDRLSDDRPAPQEGGRDPFRTGAQAGPDRDTSPTSRPSPGPIPLPQPPVEPPAPPQPPRPPPITVKFIGVVSRQDVGRVAVLSDGKNVYYGREGEIVDGRWRIVSIGEESLQIEYADGRGRQTVRLTG